MSAEVKSFEKAAIARVLILVLMEDTHWDVNDFLSIERFAVLILVLMEDTHWDKNEILYRLGLKGS